MLVLSTIAPAIFFGLALAVVFWGAWYRQRPVLACAGLGAVFALSYAFGHHRLVGWPPGSWLMPGPGRVLLAAFAAWPLDVFLARKSPGQLTRMGWLFTLLVASICFTLAGSALLGQLAGVLVALMSAYFVFALLSPQARAVSPGHWQWLAAILMLFYVAGSSLEIAPQTLPLLGSGLFLALFLGKLWRKGWGAFLALGAAIVALNLAALYWVWHSS